MRKSMCVTKIRIQYEEDGDHKEAYLRVVGDTFVPENLNERIEKACKSASCIEEALENAFSILKAEGYACHQEDPFDYDILVS